MIFFSFFFQCGGCVHSVSLSHEGLIYNLVFDQLRFLKGRIVPCMCFAHFPFVWRNPVLRYSACFFLVLK